MSSLVERIAHAKAEAAAREQATYHEAQQKSQEAEATSLQAQTIAVQLEEARKTALIVGLSPLLEVVGAREQLEEVRQVWGVGTVDSKPELFEYKTNSYLRLGVRFRFTDLETRTYVWGGGDGLDSDYHGASVLYKREAAIIVEVTKHPTIQSFFGLRDINARLYGKRVGGYKQDELNSNYKIISKTPITTPITFQKDDPAQAKKMLQDQLFQLVLDTESPRILAAEARGRISQDKYIPLLTKLFP